MLHFEFGPAQLEAVDRQEPCSFCTSSQGLLVSQIDFWDLHSAKLVQCVQCKHIQLDPKLNEAQTEKGCHAYYLKEVLEISPREQFRNQLRSFRRGVLFGFSLKSKNIHPQDVLEMGPGSGYFLDGLKFVFPEIQTTVMDIVDAVLAHCQKIHGYKTIKGAPDGDLSQINFPLNSPLSSQGTEKFDLVIARDLIEHVNDPIRLFANVAQLLQPRGYFHFITPNGHEDVWGHYMLWKNQQQRSELLINHVNYFDGRGLRAALQKKQFSPIEYYTYQLKNAFKGKGWKSILKWSKASRKLSTSSYISQQDQATVNFSKQSVYDSWYISKSQKWLTYLICFYHHYFFIKLSPERNIGHEIHGLFQKN